MNISSLTPCGLLLFVLLALGCDTSSTPSTPVAFGGGSVVRSASSNCPTGHPIAHAVGETFLCLDESVDLTAVTRTECIHAGVDCDALYGCTTKTLAQCDATTTTADCGGNGPHVFACEDSSGGRCRWFTNGCVASGFVASNCPTDEFCCASSYTGTSGPGDDFELFVASTTYAQAFGQLPIAIDDGFLLGVEQGEPSSWAGPAIECPAQHDNLYICHQSALPLTAGGTTGSWNVRTQHLGSNGFNIEIRTVATGETRARVCLIVISDAVSGACAPSVPATLECADAGTVTVGTNGARAAFTLHNASWVVDFTP